MGTQDGTYRIDGDPHTFDDASHTCIWCGHSIQDQPESCVTVVRGSRGKRKRVSKQRPALAATNHKATKPKTFIGGGKVCRDTHPVLKLGAGEFLGGSCSSPRVNDYDIYIGFQEGMARTHRSFPWKVGYEFLYRIMDMCAPKDHVSFKKMIAWVATQLEAGKRVHAGCIGGHGRTGLFLAALVHHMTGEEDAIAWVRKHYCKKGVESEEQVEFLIKHFGIKPAEPTKKHSIGAGQYKGVGDDDFFGSLHPGAPSWAKGGYNDGEESITPIPCNASVWGATLGEE